jgi:hypothetical protein
VGEAVNPVKQNTGASLVTGGLWRVVCGFFALALLVAPLEGAAAPEVSGQDKASLEAQKEALFQQMFRDPANLDVTFAYADVSARLGDYEAAVSALERMLLFNPNLPRVQLELGALYYRMGSYDLARGYFDKAAAANPPPEVRARLEQYLADIERSQSRHHLSGYVFFAGQYQTDANVAGSSLILSPIGPVVLGNQFVKQASGSMLGSGSLLYSYDMETQNHGTLEVTSVTYLNHYFNPAVNRLDLSLIEVTGGPRFNFPNLTGVKAASLKPYIIGDEVGLGWNQYFTAGGTGIEYDEIVWNDLALRAAFEFRHKNYTNAPDRPLSAGLNGNDKLVTFSAAKPITENTVLNLEFDYLDQLTQLAFYTNTTYAVAGSYRIRYDDPTGFIPYPWETTPFVGRAWSYYAAPDPCCNTSGNAFPGVYPNGFSTQSTQRWRFGVTQTWPLTATTAIVAQLERDIVSSNLPLYSYNNTSILFGPQIRF